MRISASFFSSKSTKRVRVVDTPPEKCPPHLRSGPLEAEPEAEVWMRGLDKGEECSLGKGTQGVIKAGGQAWGQRHVLR